MADEPPKDPRDCILNSEQQDLVNRFLAVISYDTHRGLDLIVRMMREFDRLNALVPPEGGPAPRTEKEGG